MLLTPEYDPTCRAIAEYLRDELNSLSERAIVAAVRDHDSFVAAQGTDFPLLQCYRGACRGASLEVCTINVEYYLFDMAAYLEEGATLHWVAYACSELLKKAHYSGRFDDCTEFLLDNLRAEPGYLKYGDNVFPNVRLSFELSEVVRVR